MVLTRFNTTECLAKPKIPNDIKTHERKIEYDVNALSAVFTELLDEKIDAL